MTKLGGFGLDDSRDDFVRVSGHQETSGTELIATANRQMRGMPSEVPRQISTLESSGPFPSLEVDCRTKATYRLPIVAHRLAIAACSLIITTGRLSIAAIRSIDS